MFGQERRDWLGFDIDDWFNKIQEERGFQSISEAPFWERPGLAQLKKNAKGALRALKGIAIPRTW
jgi:hypothetical protein